MAFKEVSFDCHAPRKWPIIRNYEIKAGHVSSYEIKAGHVAKAFGLSREKTHAFLTDRYIVKAAFARDKCSLRQQCTTATAPRPIPLFSLSTSYLTAGAPDSHIWVRAREIPICRAPLLMYGT